MQLNEIFVWFNDDEIEEFKSIFVDFVMIGLDIRIESLENYNSYFSKLNFYYNDVWIFNVFINKLGNKHYVCFSTCLDKSDLIVQKINKISKLKYYFNRLEDVIYNDPSDIKDVLEIVIEHMKKYLNWLNLYLQKLYTNI